MPGDDFHRSLILEPKGIPAYTTIPCQAGWKGEIVKAMNRLTRLQRKHDAALPRGVAPSYYCCLGRGGSPAT